MRSKNLDKMYFFSANIMKDEGRKYPHAHGNS